MPPGIGYGAAKRAMSSVRGFFGRYADEAAKVGGLGSGAANYLSGMSNSAMASVAGSALGGAYGAVADDTSIIGGMIGGAALGFGGWKGYSGLARGLSRYGKATALGVGRGEAARRALVATGRDTKNYFGAFLKSNRPVNPVPSGSKATSIGMGGDEGFAMATRAPQSRIPHPASRAGRANALAAAERTHIANVERQERLLQGYLGTEAATGGSISQTGGFIRGKKSIVSG